MSAQATAAHWQLRRGRGVKEGVFKNDTLNIELMDARVTRAHASIQSRFSSELK